MVVFVLVPRDKNVAVDYVISLFVMIIIKHDKTRYKSSCYPITHAAGLVYSLPSYLDLSPLTTKLTTPVHSQFNVKWALYPV
jgi:hypothetical protein